MTNVSNLIPVLKNVATSQTSRVKNDGHFWRIHIFTDRIKARLGFDFSAANVLEIEENRLTGKVVGEIIGRQGKAQVLNQIRDELGIKREQIIAIGDGANDLGMMTEAGISIAYHAKPIVRDHATYAIEYVGLDGVINLFK